MLGLGLGLGLEEVFVGLGLGLRAEDQVPSVVGDLSYSMRHALAQLDQASDLGLD